MYAATDKHMEGATERLAEAIKKSGMSAAELSRKTGLDSNRIYALKNGSGIMREFDIARLCVALGISADWLLGITTTDARQRVEISDDFETILICAERYACGRRTYMPSLVIDYITPLLPRLSDRALAVFERDIAGADKFGGYGDEKIDKPCWMKFLNDVRAERSKR